MHSSFTSLSKLVLVVLILLDAMDLSVHCGSNSGIFLNTEAFTAKNIDVTYQALQSSIHLSCQLDGVYVSLRRKDVIRLGVVYPNQLKLSDPECVSEVNGTHFLLHTNFQECGTNVTFGKDNSSVIVEIQLLVLPPTAILSPPTTNMAEQAVVEDSSSVEISLQCLYNGKTPANATTQNVPTTMKLVRDISRTQLDIYSTDSYSDRMSEQQLQSVVRGTSLYVQIQAFDGNNLKKTVLIDSCHLSSVPNHLPTIDSHFLIKDGCTTDDDVQFKSDAPGRFLFRAKRLYGNKPMSLYCTVKGCYFPDECASQERYCSRRGEADPESMVYTALNYALTVTRRPAAIPKEMMNCSTPNSVKAAPITDQTSSCPPPKTVSCNCASPPAGVAQEAGEVASDRSGRSGSDGLVSIELTVVVVVLSFAMGAGLVLIVWYIRLRTDPRRKMQSVAMSDDSSSSQESTVPTVKLMGRPGNPPTFES